MNNLKLRSLLLVILLVWISFMHSRAGHNNTRRYTLLTVARWSRGLVDGLGWPIRLVKCQYKQPQLATQVFI